MKRTRRVLGLLLAAATVTLAVVPAAQGAIFERFRFDEQYSDQDEICGIEVDIEGTASGHTRVRAGTGKRATAFFDHTNFAFSETLTAANGSFVTVTGNGNFNETKAVPLGGTVFRFTSIEAGQAFRLYDSQGNLLLRESGSIHFSLIFDTDPDNTPGPGGIVIEELEPRLNGQHPGFFDETLCPVVVPLLSGP